MATPKPYTLGQLNEMSAADFAASLSGVFEHSPWVAEGAAPARPFRSRKELHAVMVAVVTISGRERQLGLIRGHPVLATPSDDAGNLTKESASEQTSAGLDQGTPEENEQLAALNQQYQERFDIPFIMAVKKKSRKDILAAIETRLANDSDLEFATALEQISEIARLRLADLVSV